MIVLQAKIRYQKGKSFSRRLRMQDKIPGILYGLDKDPVSLILDHNIVLNFQKKIDFYNKSFFLSIEDKKYIVKVHAIQRHSFKLKLLHIDFMYCKK